MLLFDLQLFAHKKGVSSTKNGRDSNAQRLGTKMIRSLQSQKAELLSNVSAEIRDRSVFIL